MYSNHPDHLPTQKFFIGKGRMQNYVVFSTLAIQGGDKRISFLLQLG